jgi:hypothetical protein
VQILVEKVGQKSKVDAAYPTNDSVFDSKPFEVDEDDGGGEDGDAKGQSQCQYDLSVSLVQLACNTPR